MVATHYGVFGPAQPVGEGVSQSEEVNSVPGVRVKEGESFERAMRRFKKQCERAGILGEIRKREYYEKPSVRRKKKAAAARKRLIKKMKKEGQL